jgi:hypothetical protein
LLITPLLVDFSSIDGPCSEKNCSKGRLCWQVACFPVATVAHLPHG